MRFLLIFCLLINSSLEASFSITSGQTVTTTQTLTTSGDTGTVASGGTISTSGHGVQISNGGAKTLTNGGTITSSAAQGVRLAAGDNTVITNTGTISATTGGTNAVFLSSGITGVSFTNSGTISTTSTLGSAAFNFQSSSSSLSNSGTISSSVANASAVSLSTGTNNTITNTGTITATGSAGIGVNFGNTIGNTLNNSGTISATGTGGIAISSGTGKATVNLLSGSTVTGSISLGTGADVLINDGSISTTLASQDAVTINGSSASVTNYGTIKATGSGSIAINLNSSGSNDNTFNNTGLIEVSSGETAVKGGSGVQTLNLGAGSLIFGAIDLGGGSDIINMTSQRGVSTTLTLTNTETVNFQNDVSGVFTNNKVLVVDPTGFSIQGELANTLAQTVHGTVERNSIDSKAKERKIWGEVFGLSRTREDDSRTLAYGHNLKGFIGGIEREIRKVQAGVLIGASDGSVETTQDSLSMDTNSFISGVYAHLETRFVDLNTSFVVGIEKNYMNRRVADNIKGYETAKSDFSSNFLSPSITLSKAFKLSNFFSLRPSLRTSYTRVSIEEYSESETTSSNLTISSRDSQSLFTRAAMDLDFHILKINFGVDNRSMDEDAVMASIDGASFNIKPSDDDSVFGGFVGARAASKINERLGFTFSGEYLKRANSERVILANAQLSYLF